MNVVTTFRVILVRDITLSVMATSPLAKCLHLVTSEGTEIGSGQFESPVVVGRH